MADVPATDALSIPQSDSNHQTAQVIAQASRITVTNSKFTASLCVTQQDVLVFTVPSGCKIRKNYHDSEFVWWFGNKIIRASDRTSGVTSTHRLNLKACYGLLTDFRDFRQ
ncbi:hypothetical protein VN97_g3985 [Penicillium thymicola]|uniref:Uncharacterized protein n=1 Tax=Penicillium thymicola TaxID=293382 RepID=A0AAI9TL26_PENTH|nr:hypothetical protein VN97_g3985 [Penicillium thymicola]